MNETNQKIDFILKQRRRRIILIGILILVTFSIFTTWFYTPPLGSITEISGIVTRLANESGEDLYLVVKLRNGEIIRSYIPNSMQYKRGAEVKLQKREALLFGKPSYKYMGYVEKNA